MSSSQTDMREKLQSFLLHDLKNPISSLLLQAEMKLDQAGQDSEAAGLGDAIIMTRKGS